MRKGLFSQREDYFPCLKLVSFLLFCLFITTGSFLVFNAIGIPPAQAHLDHLPHFNSGGNRYGYGDYISYIALEPEYGTTDHPSRLTFSVQDFNGNDIYNLMTMVEIYDSISGKRIHLFPWTFRDVGDFHLYYEFPKKGIYQIVLSVRDSMEGIPYVNYGQSTLGFAIEPSRSILGDVSECDCTRTIFNISIADTFGSIQNSLFFTAIASPLVLLGVVLSKNYYKRKGAKERRKSDLYSNVSSEAQAKHYNANIGIEGYLGKKHIVKYSIMLLALAGGIVHLVVFPQHGSLHVYYSIFLLAAAGGQIAYGVLYFLVMLSKPFYEIPIEQRHLIKTTYRHNVAVNLFGFMGTAILVGLYIYVVIFPPPLSPTNQPEEIEIAGILSKSVEVALLIGIMLIIRWDRQAFQKILLEITHH